MLPDQQFQILITSTDSMTLQVNYQRVVQQLKTWKTDYKNLHQDNIKLHESSQLLQRQLTKKNQHINELSKDIIKLTKLILQNDQSQSDIQLILKDLQNQVKGKDIQIQSLKRNVTPQKESSLQDALKEASQSLEKARRQLQSQVQKSLKFTEQIATLKKENEQKKIQIEKLNHSFQFQKRKINKYENQIALLNQQADKKDIKVRELCQQLEKVRILTQEKKKQHSENICALNQQLKLLSNEADILKIQIKTNANQIKKQVDKSNQQVIKSNEQLKKKVHKLQQKINLLQIRCKDEAEANKQLQQLLNAGEKQYQQLKMNEQYMRKQAEQYRDRLKYKPQINLYELKTGIENYFLVLNKNLAEDNEINDKQHETVIESEKNQLLQILNAFAKFSK